MYLKGVNMKKTFTAEVQGKTFFDVMVLTPFFLCELCVSSAAPLKRDFRKLQRAVN